MEAYDCVGLFSRLVQDDPNGLRYALLNSADTTVILLCYAAGNSGTTNVNAINALRQRSGREGFYGMTDIAARVALAKLGFEEDETLSRIEQALARNGPESARALNAMCFVQPRPQWIVRFKSVIPMLLSEGDNDLALNAAFLAAACGSNGSYCLPGIQQRRAAEERRPGGGMPVWYDFPISRLSNPQGRWITADLLKLLGNEDIGFDHTVAAVLLEIQYLLIKDEDLGRIASLLESSDPEVVVGACRLSWSLGLRARSIERQLLKVAETTSTSDCREAAFFALGAAGSSELVPDLRRLKAVYSQDSYARKFLVDALNLIQGTETQGPRKGVDASLPITR